jgi:16S rRNA (adenine1518-N6/adenine1519-N6)-dimethyltransferase
MTRIDIVKKPKKSLGQNFLIDDNISRKIVNLLDIDPNDEFIEIGPGYGSLTKYILEKTKYLTCVEIDSTIAKKITADFPSLKIINDDILNVSLSNIINSPKKLRIIGNIPYNITSQIIFHIIDQRELVKDLTIMLQLEVAQRIVANPKTKAYGILSVMIQAYSKPTLLFKIPPTCFFPKPRVDSGIISLDFSKTHNAQIKNHNIFRKLVRTTFAKRRKILSNSIKDLSDNFDYKTINFNFTQRAEELSVEEFIKLSNMISEKYENL